ncbi:nickel pincer cofactor biosynthesis protein LarB [Endozoicomonas atrinae]|uniref:nickel pincer cofactor biosynthesis protein LarB n=1 Tax=Endozoicomonas atrinae TaxID=1333660 RepID=UPI00082493AE|nr:nickel pincer cofactor biosynthesis protein LarB [Endozoicomonas atrinae]
MEVLLDLQRADRTGLEEAIFCQGKSAKQIASICQNAIDQNYRLLLTRLIKSKYQALPDNIKTALSYNPESNTAVLGQYAVSGKTRVAVVSGGTSDISVCREAVITLNYHGFSCDEHYDLGVTGLWRLLERLEILKSYHVIIAAAGMEAALPTVLSGLVKAPVIALPTSVGYGISEGGRVALESCLASCSGSLLTVNIDNGFGAACAAIKILNLAGTQ